AYSQARASHQRSSHREVLAGSSGEFNPAGYAAVALDRPSLAGAGSSRYGTSIFANRPGSRRGCGETLWSESRPRSDGFSLVASARTDMPRAVSRRNGVGRTRRALPTIFGTRPGP